MSRYDVVVIGSGMGGLTCAAMLAKEGMKVCVVEKNHRPGGCLQSFRRGGRILDTGIHYVGSLREGQTMHQYLKYLGVLPRITLRGLDPEGFDLIHLEGRTFRHALGYDNFVEGLAADFPAERSGIAAYARLLQRIGGSIAPEVLRRGQLSAGATEDLGVSAAAAIDELVGDPLLRRVLAGSAPLYGGRRDMSPLYHHAMINHSNIEGAASFAGGTQRLADALAEVLRAAGGELLCDARASRLHLSGGSVCTVELNDGEQQLETRWVISDIAPAATFALVDPTPLLRRSFLHRMESLPYTYGLFTAHVRVRPGALPYCNCNHYLYNTPDVWSEQPTSRGATSPWCSSACSPRPKSRRRPTSSR